MIGIRERLLLVRCQLRRCGRKCRISRTIRPLYIPVEKSTKFKDMGSQPVYASVSVPCREDGVHLSSAMTRTRPTQGSRSAASKRR
jgi:hypothetical protein